MSPKPFPHCARVILITTLFWSIGGRAAPLDIPNFPLFLTSVGVTPNIILTLDDSGSMRRAFVPEHCGDSSDCAALDNRWAKSAHANALYYNPNITYAPPKNGDGTEHTTYFNSAWRNGFFTSGTVGGINFGFGRDLSTNFQPTANLDMQESPAEDFMGHYSEDVRCKSSSPYYCEYKNEAGAWVTTTTSCSGSGSTARNNSCRGTHGTGYNPFGMPSYYYVYNEANTGCTGTATEKKKNNACYDIKLVSNNSGPGGTDERQNFANWYSFYRTRNLATVSGASRAFSTLDSTARLGWQALNSCRGGNTSFVDSNCDGWTGTYGSNAIGYFSGTKKTNFYNWLGRVRTSSGTPLRLAMTRVGEYIRTTTGENSPWDNDFSTSSSGEHSCRRNFHILMTDGIWNDSDSSISIGNVDNTSVSTLEDDTGSYNPTKSPYKDSSSKTLADVAFKYWVTDLRKGTNDNSPTCTGPTCNKLSPVYVDFSGNDSSRYWNAKNNPATWQNLVNFTIGLGLTDFLAAAGLTWGGSTYSGSYPELVSGDTPWPPATESMGSAGANYGKSAHDLWHAAINSRGKFFSAESPAQIVSAFQEILDTVSSQAAAGGGARVSSNLARITEANPTAFLARFNADWSGTLEAFPFEASGNLGATPYWEAGSLIPPGNLEAPSATRKIFTLNDGSAQEFTISICNSSSPLKAALNQDASEDVDDLCSQRLAWLRGYTTITDASWDSDTRMVTFTAPNHGLKADDSVIVSGVNFTVTTVGGGGNSDLAYNEGPYTVAASPTEDTFTIVETLSSVGERPEDELVTVTYVADGVNDKVRYANFRDRSSVLGDIMNSGTVYAHKENFGYGGASIAVTGGGDSYKTYVTDKASRTPVVYVGANDGMLHAFNAEISGADMGKELFAYVPAGVYHNLSALTGLYYSSSHKYYVDGTPTLRDAYIGGSWKTYLVGGLRAGGKSIYALDVSNPNGFSSADVKWEFNDSSILTPTTPGNDMGLTFGQPQIAAISETQWAVIFGNGYNSASEDAVLFIVDLADGLLIAKIATNDTTSNGLSTPFPFDKDGDGIVDVIYAGDLQGNLWKFKKDSGNWVLGNGGVPLFIARNASNQVQAITTQPNAILVDDKVMVYFGTGRYLEASDLTNDEVQTFYAIEDKESSPGTVSRTALLEQTIISSTVTADSFTARTVTRNTTTDPNNRGCYLDFPATPGQPSERIGSASLIKFFTTPGLDTRVIFTTATPTADPCEKSGTSWLMELSTTCGRLGGTSPFDINQDQEFDEEDLVTIAGEPEQTVSGLALKPTTGIVTEITWVEGDPLKGIAYKVLPGSTGQVEVIANSSDRVTPGGPPKKISWEQIQ